MNLEDARQALIDTTITHTNPSFEPEDIAEAIEAAKKMTETFKEFASEDPWDGAMKVRVLDVGDRKRYVIGMPGLSAGCYAIEDLGNELDGIKQFIYINVAMDDVTLETEPFQVLDFSYGPQYFQRAIIEILTRDGNVIH